MQQNTFKSQRGSSSSGQQKGSGTKTQPSAPRQHGVRPRAPQPVPTSVNQPPPPYQPPSYQNQFPPPPQFMPSFSQMAFPVPMMMGTQASQPIQITLNIQSAGFPQNYLPAFSMPPPTSAVPHTQEMSAHQQPQSKPSQASNKPSKTKNLSPTEDTSSVSGSTSNSKGQGVKGQHTRGQGRGIGSKNFMQQRDETSAGVTADKSTSSGIRNRVPSACSSSRDDRSSVHSEASSSARGNMRGNRSNNQRGRGFNRGRGGTVGDRHNVNVADREQQQQQQQHNNTGSSGQSGGRGQRSGRRGPRGGRVNRGQRGAINQNFRPAAAFSGTSTAEPAPNSYSTQINSDRGHGSRFQRNQRFSRGSRRGWVTRGRAGHVIATSISVDNRSVSDLASTAGNDEWSDEDVASSSGVNVVSNIVQPFTTVVIPRGSYRGRGRGRVRGRGRHHSFSDRAARALGGEEGRQCDSSNLNTYVSEWINRNVLSTRIETGSDVEDGASKLETLSEADDTEWVDVTETVVQNATFESDNSKLISIQKSRRPIMSKRGRGRGSRAVKTRRQCEERDDEVQDEDQPESDAEDAKNRECESSDKVSADGIEQTVGQILSPAKLSKGQKQRLRQKNKKMLNEQEQSGEVKNIPEGRIEIDDSAEVASVGNETEDASLVVQEEQSLPEVATPTKLSRRKKKKLPQKQQQVCDEICVDDNSVTSDSAVVSGVEQDSSGQQLLQPQANKVKRKKNKVQQGEAKDAAKPSVDKVSIEDSVENVASAVTVEQVNDCPSKLAVTENKVDENTIIGFMVNNHRGRCQLNQLRNLLGNEMQLSDIEQLLRPFRRIKVFKNLSNLGRSVAFVHLRGLRICGQRPTCRAGDGCNYLHLCPDLIAFPNCRNVSRCQRSHDLHDAHNTAVMEKVGVLTICKDKSVLLDVVRSSNGVVCAAHNKLLEPICTPETCLKLHVCNSFLHGRCLLPSSSCNFGHDLYTSRNGTLLELFELKNMQTTNERFLFQIISIGDLKPDGSSGDDQRERGGPGKTKGKTPCGKTNVGSHGGSELDRPEGGASLGARTKENITVGKLSEALNDLTVSSTVLCKEYEPHHCQSDKSCRQRHSDRSFVWRLMLHNVWLPFEDDVVIERAFCDPSVQSVQTSFKSNPVTVNFKTMSCEMGAVQRLTTPSYVICRNEADATRWCWYWNERKYWNRFAEDKPPFQDIMESKYLHDKSAIVCFENSGKSGRDYQQYLVDFGTMQQTNLKTGFIRAICRRPVFHLGNDSTLLSKVNFHYDPERLPINECWSPMNTVWDGWTDLVPFTEKNQELKHLYSRVSAEFMKSLPSGAVKICKIYRIQNRELWKKYLEKKTKMSKVTDMPQPFERYLFHGTPDEQTVRCICHQNFDPRMHGRHGTVYGKGAYFSTTSKYSHGYTKPVGGSRYMFYARVLVGKSTLGTKDLPRPPAIDPSRPFGILYDTCVNNEKNPNIFVVFDNEQCYPEFLIEYQELTPPAVDPTASAAAVSQQQTASDAVGGAETERDPKDQGCFLM